jgi:hypothetical protein
MTTVTFKAVIKNETDRAMLLVGTFNAPNNFYGINCWVPKSIITMRNETTAPCITGAVKQADITLPTWFTQKNSTKF